MATKDGNSFEVFDMEPGEIERKRFGKRVMGVDPREVEKFIQELSEELRRLKTENAGLKKDIQDQEKALLEFREREVTIRNVLVSAQKSAEQVRANAEKEARLIVSEAELKAEKIIQAAYQRVAGLQEEMSGLKRHRIQFESKLRSLLDAFRQILDAESESGEGPEDKPAPPALQPHTDADAEELAEELKEGP
jgi:cell division initiation protein